MMNRMLKAYRLKNSNTIVTKKSIIQGTTDDDYEQVDLIISADEIMMMNDEIELLGLVEVD